MIISATKPETAEWMDEFTNYLIIILQNMLMNGTLNIFKIRGLTLKGVLKDLREGVRKQQISGKPFGICVFLGGQNPSFTLKDNFFVFFKELVDQVLKNPKQPQDEVKKEPQVELPKLDPQVELQVELSKLDPQVVPQVETQVVPQVETQVVPQVETQVVPQVVPQVVSQVETQVVPQVVPQVEPNQCLCEGFSSSCVCARRSCYCARCVESPCDKFLPAIKIMRNMSYNFLRQISSISILLSLRFPGRLRSPSDFNTAIVLRNLTHANEFQLNSSTRRKLLHMSLAIKLTKLLFGRFTYSSPGGRKWINRMEKRLNSRFFLKRLQKGYCVEKDIPWHNKIRGMSLYSFNYVFCNPNYYSFLVSVALNPNPFRWIFDNWKQFSRISISIEEEVQSIRWYSSSHRMQSYGIYCQSNVVEQRIISYRNAILYGNYGSFPDFLKRLVRELDLMVPPQDDFNVCVRKR
jgi:hypothetical protein